MPRLENLVGAWSLTVADRLAASGREAGLSSSDQAALATLLAHPGETVSWLGEVLALTSSGATRLVDRLVASGWVTRSPGGDSRQRVMRLTPEGEALARRVVEERERVLAASLADLGDDERRTLERTLERLVGASTERLGSALRTCRLCDRSACWSAGQACPLAHTREEARDG